MSIFEKYFHRLIAVNRRIFTNRLHVIPDLIPLIPKVTADRVHLIAVLCTEIPLKTTNDSERSHPGQLF